MITNITYFLTQVIDEDKTGDGLVSGKLVNGSRPYGRLCGSQIFNYSIRYGPFQTCGSYRVSDQDGATKLCQTHRNPAYHRPQSAGS